MWTFKALLKVHDRTYPISWSPFSKTEEDVTREAEIFLGELYPRCCKVEIFFNGNLKLESCCETDIYTNVLRSRP